MSCRTYRIRHGDTCVGHKPDFPLAGQIYINNSIAIEANLQFLVCPQVIIFSIFICLTHNSFKNKTKQIIENHTKSKS